jgi:hypothetical protein
MRKGITRIVEEDNKRIPKSCKDQGLCYYVYTCLTCLFLRERHTNEILHIEPSGAGTIPAWYMKVKRKNNAGTQKLSWKEEGGLIKKEEESDT